MEEIVWSKLGMLAASGVPWFSPLSVNLPRPSSNPYVLPMAHIHFFFIYFSHIHFKAMGTEVHGTPLA